MKMLFNYNNPRKKRIAVSQKAGKMKRKMRKRKHRAHSRRKHSAKKTPPALPIATNPKSKRKRHKSSHKRRKNPTLLYKEGGVYKGTAHGSKRDYAQAKKFIEKKKAALEARIKSGLPSHRAKYEYEQAIKDIKSLSGFKRKAMRAVSKRDKGSKVKHFPRIARSQEAIDKLIAGQVAREEKMAKKKSRKHKRSKRSKRRARLSPRKARKHSRKHSKKRSKKHSKKPAKKVSRKRRVHKRRKQRTVKLHAGKVVRRMKRMRKGHHFKVHHGKKKFHIKRRNPEGAGMDKFEQIMGISMSEAGFILASGAIIQVLDGVVTAGLSMVSPSIATAYESVPFAESFLPIGLAIAAQKLSKDKRVHDAAEGLMAGALVNIGQDLVAMLTPAPATAAASGMGRLVQGPRGQTGFGRLVQGPRGQTGFGRLVQGPRGQTGFGKVAASARKSSFKGSSNGDTVLDDGNNLYLPNSNDYDSQAQAQAACSSVESASAYGTGGEGGSEESGSLS